MRIVKIVSKVGDKTAVWDGDSLVAAGVILKIKAESANSLDIKGRGNTPGIRARVCSKLFKIRLEWGHCVESLALDVNLKEIAIPFIVKLSAIQQWDATLDLRLRRGE